jgi:hypothetical protein
VNRKRVLLVLSMVLLITSLGSLQAQGPADPRLVYVSVIVTEAKGLYVTGLATEDFGILEDGVEQTVAFLEEDSREHEYRIGYLSKNGARDGGWRRIRVRIANPLFARMSVLTTMGYYAR